MFFIALKNLPDASLFWYKLSYSGENKPVARTGEVKRVEPKDLTLHETMEIHEILNFKTICMTMSKLAQGVVFDQELKKLLGQDTQQSIKDVETLQGLLVKTQPH